MYLPHWRLRSLSRVLHSGGVIAYPTEAVWGLGCDPDDEQAVRRICQLKQRPLEKGLLLIAGHWGQLSPWLDTLQPQQLRVLEQHWPGPYTFLLPDPEAHAGDWVRGQHANIAVRLTDHPLAAALCNQFGGPLVSTSANPAGAEPARHRFQLRHYFADQLDAISPGALGHNRQPSTIIDLETGRVLRPGA